MKLPDLEDINAKRGARVLLRSDLNCPLEISEEDGVIKTRIRDNFRIKAALETIGLLSSRGYKITLASHLDRPKGTFDPRYVMEPVRKAINKDYPEVQVLENLRFNPGEEGCDQDFIKQLVKDQDFYVNDAFGVSHRPHASIVGPPKFLPSYAGALLEREVKTINSLFEKPERPFVAILGGAKISDKLGVLRRLAETADYVLVGGAMAFTLLKANGVNVGDSLVEPEFSEEAFRVFKEYPNIVLPLDFVSCLKSDLETNEDEFECMCDSEIKKGWVGADIGPQSVEHFFNFIALAKTIFWNGPMGIYEHKQFRAGTEKIARFIATLKAFSVIGGGDSASAVRKLNLEDCFSYISTGGGASLELIENGTLVGIEALKHAVGNG